MKARIRRSTDIPGRLTTGAYILHSGWAKLRRGTDEQAARLHGMATSAYPLLADIPPRQFLTTLAVGEIGVGTALLLPFVPDRIAGAMLSGFAGALVGMYLRTPAMREPGSIWPSSQGTAVSKDVWLLAIGVRLVIAD